MTQPCSTHHNVATPSGANNQSQPQPSQPSPRMRRPDRSQPSGQTIDELVPPDHKVRKVWEFVINELDTSSLEANIKAVEGSPGRNATLPALLVALWIYATLEKVTEARALERRCQEDAPFRWLCGGVHVNYHLLSDFRVQHQSWLTEQITRVVQILCEEDLASFEEAGGQDGMRTRASAGASSFRSAEALERLLEEAQQPQAQPEATAAQSPEGPALTAAQRAARQRAASERIERIEQAQEAEREVRQTKEKRKKGDGRHARGSTTDPVCRKMKMADGGTRPAYNVQFMTLLSTLVIIGVYVTNVGSDNGEAAPMISQIQASFGKTPKDICFDGGFSSCTNIDPLAAMKLTVFSPVKQAAEKLAKGEDPYAPKRGDSPAMAAWRQRMGTPEAQEQYKERCKCELPNAWCRNHGLHQFVVRGLEKVNEQVKWYVLAYNLERLMSLRAQRAVAQAA